MSRSFDIAEQIINFAKTNLDLNVPDDREKKKLLENVQWCWRHWSETPKNTLVIIDDVVEYKEIKLYLPPIKSGFKVLLTSKFEIDSSINHLTLEVLSPDKALELLQLFIGKDRTIKEYKLANLICQELGYLPLALELVGRYLYEDPQLSLEDMLKRLISCGLEDESINLEDTQDIYPTMNAQRGVKAVFELTWQELDIFAMNIGKFLAFFQCQDWELVKLGARYLGYSDQQIRSAKKQLQKRYIIKFLDNIEFIIHPLIRLFLSYKNNQLERIENQFVFDKALASLIESDPYRCFETITKNKFLSAQSFKLCLTNI